MDGPGALVRSETGEQLVKQKGHMGIMNPGKKAKFRLQHVSPAKRGQARCGIQRNQFKLADS